MTALAAGLAASLESDRPALVHGDVTLSYRELGALAGGLGARLREAGAVPGEPVAIWGGRRWETVASIVGVLLSGSPYCVLDPALPPARIERMLGDLRPKAVIAAASGPVPGWTGPLVELGGAQGDLSPVPDNDLAYVMYTSGSTGRPKGVVIRQDSVVNLVRAYDELGPSPHPPITSMMSAPTFDVSVWEMFSTFLCGGTLHVLEAEAVRDPDIYVNYVRRHGISSGYVPPHLLAPLVDRLEADELPCSLNRLFAGVEPTPQGVLQRLRDRVPALRILYGYGPTEVTISATVHVFEAMTDPHRRTPIGKALSGYEVFVVDDELSPVPDGAVGEIIVGGAGLAVGYLNLPEQTAQRFVACPLAARGRVYRTGDYGRFLPSGDVEFVGRRDSQVKVRGYRIELGEIEQVLSAHPGVRRVVALAPETSTGRRLVAAVESTGDITDLRQWAAAQLPPYAVPDRIVVIDRFPVTGNGKVDTKTLLALAPEHVVTEFAAPEQDWELAVTEEWCRVLDVPRLGLDDDVLVLGGDSISAAVVAAALRRRGWQVRVADLMTKRSVRALAGCVTPRTEQVVRELLSGPLSPAQEGLWAFRMLNPGEPGTTVAHAVEVRGSVDRPRLVSGLEALTRKHDALRVHLDLGDGPEQHVHDEVELPLRVWEVDTEDIAVSRMHALVDRVFDTEGLQWAVELIVHPTGALVVFVADHLVFDGACDDIVLQDLAAAYAGQPLPEVVPSAADLAVAQRRHLESEVGRRARAFWRGELTGYGSPALVPEADGGKPEFAEWLLDAETDRALRALAGELGASTFTVLTSGVQAFLALRSGVSDCCVSIAVSQRDVFGAEDRIGHFVTLLPLRRTITPEATVRDDLARGTVCVHRALRNATVPFETMLADARDVADVDGLARVVITQDVNSRGSRAVDGVTFTSGDTLILPTLYDLALFVVDHGGPLRLRMLAKSASVLGSGETFGAQLSGFLRSAAQAPDELLPTVSR